MQERNDVLALFGASPRVRAESIIVAAALADDDLLAGRGIDSRTIADDLRRRLIVGGVGTRRVYGVPDVDAVFGNAQGRFPEGAIGFYSDALPRWQSAIVAHPELVRDALTWLCQNRPVEAAA